ncbi:MAG: hypothetical protein NTW16_01820 [Bacteroidetes bacterium]|nr:hypothetical protein [Bacteroidota bacterium]
MSNSKTNLLTHGFSGIVGKQYVMRMKGDQQIIAARPKRDTNVYSDSQLKAREAFANAVAYARGAMKDPVKKAAYAVRGAGRLSAYASAVADFFKLPWITAIETDRYHGAVGEIIHVAAGDYFMVVEVFITITDASGNLIEKGYCVLNEVSNKWGYTATVENAVLAGTTITAVVRDLPDHMVEQSVTL